MTMEIASSNDGRPRTRPVLVVAGVSARVMAQSAGEGGWDVIALDLFGDRDTRRSSRGWKAVGERHSLSIDGRRLYAALAEAARLPGIVGWVAGSGFEGDPQMLEQPAGLPLIGMPGPDVATLRDARRFFDTLDRLGVAHPEVAFERPADTFGWLAKRSGGSGGWHIAAAQDGGHVHADTYWQRIQPGETMSALVLADGVHAQVVALNRLLVQPHPEHPYVYTGAIGPISDDVLESRVEGVLEALVPAFSLRGLMSLDFIAAPDGIPMVLEINPRPSASMQLHDQRVEGGLMRAHVEAAHGRLPALRPRVEHAVHGHLTVFAPCEFDLDAAVLDALDDLPYCHDVAAQPGIVEPGQPVCTVSAFGASADAVEGMLFERCADVHARLLAHALKEDEE
jgi:predicted ATP-grasp superfamily ATP-dependent carboligase